MEPYLAKRMCMKVMETFKIGQLVYAPNGKRGRIVQVLDKEDEVFRVRTNRPVQFHICHGYELAPRISKRKRKELRTNV